MAEKNDTVCQETNDMAEIIDNIDLNKPFDTDTISKNVNLNHFKTYKQMSISFPEKDIKYNSTIANCEELEFNKAQDNLYNAQNTFKKIYDFIENYRIDKVANYGNLNREQTEKLINDLNIYIDKEIKANDPVGRKKITLEKLKAVLDFKGNDNVPANLLSYNKALEANLDKIKYYLNPSFFQGGKHRTKSRKSSHRKKSRSRSRSKGRSKSKRKNKSKK